MNTTLSLDSINLPQDEAEKPAELNKDLNAGDPGLEGSEEVVETPTEDKKEEPTPTEDKKPEEKPTEEGGKDDANNQPDKTDGDGTKTEDQKPEEGGKPADGSTTDGDAAADNSSQKVIPFNEHPDWIKTQKEKDDLKSEVESLKEQVASLSKGAGATQEQIDQASKTADEKMDEKIKAGWEPKSVAEYVAQHSVYLKDEILAAIDKKEQEKKATEDQANTEKETLLTNAAAGFNENEIKTVEEKTKISDLIKQWHTEKIVDVNPSTIKGLIGLAARQLKADGQLSKPANPEVPKPTEPTPEEKAAAEAEAKKKEETNKRISNTGSDGTDAASTQKKSYAEMHNRSLDQITLDAAKKLG